MSYKHQSTDLISPIQSMGNFTTTLDLDPFFKDPITEKASPDDEIVVQVNLPSPGARLPNRLPTRQIYLHISMKKGLRVDYEATNRITNVWTPKTRLREFEVIDPLSPKEKRIGRWAGVGVLCVDALNSYVKLYFEGDQENPTLRWIYTIWNHSNKAREILSQDLGLGYAVLYLTGTDYKEHRLLEPIRNQDEKETVIFAPGIPKELGAKAKKRPKELEREHAKKRVRVE